MQEEKYAHLSINTIQDTDTALRRYFFKFAQATGRAIVPHMREGKSGQQRAMYRLRAGVILAWAHDTESATENNHPADGGKRVKT